MTRGDPAAADKVEHESCRPDFSILIYPVIDMKGHFRHEGSGRALLGEHPSPELLDELSNHTQVTAETPPAFLLATHEDKSVPAENSVLYFLALREAGVPAELHVFEYGPHGFGMQVQDKPELYIWPTLLENWLRQRKLLIEK